ncbi:unnamed protein product [Amoebophrya sp. A120]|nr:unnamed protein product [Amoebophrya sp. A120]|eukprot:GSA120T00011617001.1
MIVMVLHLSRITTAWAYRAYMTCYANSSSRSFSSTIAAIYLLEGCPAAETSSERGRGLLFASWPVWPHLRYPFSAVWEFWTTFIRSKLKIHFTYRGTTKNNSMQKWHEKTMMTRKTVKEKPG